MYFSIRNCPIWSYFFMYVMQNNLQWWWRAGQPQEQQRLSSGTGLRWLHFLRLLWLPQVQVYWLQLPHLCGFHAKRRTLGYVSISSCPHLPMQVQKRSFLEFWFSSFPEEQVISINSLLFLNEQWCLPCHNYICNLQYFPIPMYLNICVPYGR